jgi:hypothetical protein
VAAEQVHAKTHNFFVNRITDPIELSMPIKDRCASSGGGREKLERNTGVQVMMFVMIDGWMTMR